MRAAYNIVISFACFPQMDIKYKHATFLILQTAVIKLSTIAAQEKLHWFKDGHFLVEDHPARR